MILTRADGIVARTPQEAEQAQLAGYKECATYHRAGIRRPVAGYCPFFLSPETQGRVTESGGYYTCPICNQSSDLLHELPWHGVPDEDLPPEQQNLGFQAGGGTRIGLGMDVQAQIGEDLVAKLGELPGYGPITWVHSGPAAANSPLDMATKDWGIEVKTLGYDTSHHRFIPGRAREKEAKNAMAASMNKLGILGVLVLLDYRRSMADIYVREFPLDTGGVKTFRSHQGQHLIAEVPFRNPLMDSSDPSPKAEGFSYIPPPEEDWGF